MRLLTDTGPTLQQHQATHGALLLPPRPQLLDAVDAAGLLGRGGAGFPTGRKLRTVAAGKSPVVLGNGCEGEPASGKDTLLLSRHPHLVLDGLAVAAHAVGATAIFTPPRPFEQGIDRRPTFVSNVETLAHLALIARRGPAWFREVGDAAEPGTLLLTVDGRVVEVATGSALTSVLSLNGVQAVLVGGYFGTWMSSAQAQEATLTHRDLRASGGALGAGIVLTLPVTSCGVVETARVATYLAGESAGQCGPCLNGLPAIASAIRALAVGPWDDATMTSLDRWLDVVPGRGACRHPDGAVRLALSALQVFAEDVARHRHGRPCAGARAAPVLPVPRRAAA